MNRSDYSHFFDIVINPLTNQPIEKYGHAWYYLIRKGYNENKLESLPLLTIDFIISPKTKQPIERYGSHWYELIQHGFNEKKLNEIPLILNKMTYVKNLDMQKNKPKRGGVVLFTRVKNQLFFGLGLDTIYDELTDFSGGISYKKDKNAIDGSLRELCEETEGLFNLTHQDVIEAPVIIDKHNLIIFLHVENPEQVSEDFQKCRICPTLCDSEIKSIVWLTEDELKMAIKWKLPYIYSRLRNFLNKFDFYAELK